MGITPCKEAPLGTNLAMRRATKERIANLRHDHTVPDEAVASSAFWIGQCRIDRRADDHPFQRRQPIWISFRRLSSKPQGRAAPGVNGS
jgi:hypothetical protein